MSNLQIVKKMGNTTKKAIGIIAFVLLSAFIFYLLNFNFKGTFQGMFRSICGETLSEKSGVPESWLNRYGIDLNKEEDLEIDTDGDGLTLLAEYENSTNPLDPDTDGDGFNDGKEVSDGYSPIGEGKLDQDQDGLADFWEKEAGLSVKENNAMEDQDKDGLSNDLEYAHLTDPFNEDSDGDGFSDSEEIANGYDPTAPGEVRPKFEISIKKIKVEAPVVWAKNDNEKALLKDLESGVVRLPETGIPGQRGNTVISGHSSNYVWAKGDYNYIFEKINDLEVGDQIIIKATEQSGKVFEYVYIIKSKDVVKPNDALIFKSLETPTVTLVTCWPLRTTWKRMVVKAELVEK